MQLILVNITGFNKYLNEYRVNYLDCQKFKHVINNLKNQFTHFESSSNYSNLVDKFEMYYHAIMDYLLVIPSIKGNNLSLFYEKMKSEMKTNYDKNFY